MSKKKVLFVATVVKGHINVFHLPFLKWFKEQGYETHVCAKNDFDDGKCSIPYCDVFHNTSFSRNPLNFGNFKAYNRIKSILVENHFEIIHCHTPVAGVLTRFAAIKTRKKGSRIIYTAHGFHFFKGASLLNWLLFFPIEWMSSFFTDELITINSEDYEVAKKYFKPKNIHLIHGVGIDSDYIKKLCVDKLKYLDEFSIPETAKILLSVGELSNRKNHKVVIEALSSMNNLNIFYIVCGRGEKLDALKRMTKQYGLQDNVIFTGFRSDVKEFYHIADAFIFPSKQEGLPVALMEALAANLPCIVSKVRGNVDLIQSCKKSVIVENCNKIEIANAINHVLAREQQTEHCTDVRNYDLVNILESYIKIYSLNEGEKI